MIKNTEEFISGAMEIVPLTHLNLSIVFSYLISFSVVLYMCPDE